MTALAFGKPLLLTDVGGFPDIAAEGAAELVPPDDVAALHQAIKRLITDPAARARLGDGARAAARGPFSWSTIGAQTTSVYAQVIEGHE